MAIAYNPNDSRGALLKKFVERRVLQNCPHPRRKKRIKQLFATNPKFLLKREKMSKGESRKRNSPGGSTDSYMPRIVHPKEEWDVYADGKTKALVAKGMLHFPWANPYWSTFRNATNLISAEEAMRLYEKRIRERPDLWRRLDELRGKRLACWCASNKPWCHSVVLCQLVEERERERRLVQRRIASVKGSAEASTPCADSLLGSLSSRSIFEAASEEGDSNCDRELCERPEGEGKCSISTLEAVVSFCPDFESILRWRRDGGPEARSIVSGPSGVLLARRALGNGYRWLMPDQFEHDWGDYSPTVRGSFEGPTPGRELDTESADSKLIGEDGSFRFRPARWWCDTWWIGNELQLPPLEVVWARGDKDRSWATRTGVFSAIFHEFTAVAPSRPVDPIAKSLLETSPRCDPYRALEGYAVAFSDRYGETFGFSSEARSHLLGADGYRLLCSTDGFDGDQEVCAGGYYEFRVRPALIAFRSDDPSLLVSAGKGSTFRLGWIVSSAKAVFSDREISPPFRFVLAMSFLDKSAAVPLQ